ncbi:MAG: type II toxin-antitoxin system VapC family toxin [Candidatus Hadarchaeales archaeon]
MYLLDTNIFLEVLLSGPRKEECRKFLELVWRGDAEGVVTDFTIHSILIIMGRLKRWKELSTFLSSLLAYRGLKIHWTSISDELRAIDLSRGRGLEVEDAMQYSVAVGERVEAIVSLDKHFDGLDVPRVEPKDINR